MQPSRAFFRPACSLVGAAFLQRLRVPVSPLSGLAQQTRLLAEDAHASGTYIDKQEVTDRVLTVVKNFQKVDPAKVTPSANFQKDLGLDSLDTVEVVMAFEEEFALEIPDAEADKIQSTADAIDYIASHPQAK